MAPPQTGDHRFTVDDMQIGAEDVTGERIERIYAKASPRFSVYHTSSRVSVQYSDDPVEAVAQRKRMASLNGTRTQIDGLIDGWRASRVDQAAGAGQRTSVVTDPDGQQVACPF